MDIQGWSDSSYNSDKTTGRTCGGYVFTFGDAAVSWKSKWFTAVYPSSTESEIAALFLACSKAMWLRKLLLSFGYGLKSSLPINVDNQSAIKYCKSMDTVGRMQHMDPKFFWIREVLNSKEVYLNYVHTTKNLSDVLTKSLRGSALDKFRTLLGLQNLDYGKV
jgi:hypothetical protein